MEHPEYPTGKSIVDKLYEVDEEFQKSISTTIKEFGDRLQKRKSTDEKIEVKIIIKIFIRRNSGNNVVMVLGRKK